MSTAQAKATIVAVSDALGHTASDVALAARSQFSSDVVDILRLPKVSDRSQVEEFLAPILERKEPVCVFLTIVDPELWIAVCDLLADLHVPVVDLMGPAVAVLGLLLDHEPKGVAGTLHRTDEEYYRRIEAMEYFVDHDDGRSANDIAGADIVLLGVSRTSKTPLSMYLAFQGYKVANIPLVPGIRPPDSVFRVERSKLIGLLSSPELVADIREQRLGKSVIAAGQGGYANIDSIAREMQEAHALMSYLGCFIVHTDHKAIEESATEIIAHLEEIERQRTMHA